MLLLFISFMERCSYLFMASFVFTFEVSLHCGETVFPLRKSKTSVEEGRYARGKSIIRNKEGG